jgi:hypothetical protein
MKLTLKQQYNVLNNEEKMGLIKITAENLDVEHTKLLRKKRIIPNFRELQRKILKLKK